MGGDDAGVPQERREDIEWVDDGLGVISWRRGWPDFLRPRHVVLGTSVGLAAGTGLWLAGLDAAAAVGGAWFFALGTLLVLSDAIGRILPDRYIILATVGLALVWAVDAAVAREPGRLLWPLLWAAVAVLGFLALMVLGALLTRDPDALGAGDVKVMAPIGLWLGRWGWEVLLVGVIAGVFLAGAWVLVLAVTRRIGLRGGTIAYGPWLIGGAAVATAGVAALVTLRG